MSDPKQKEFNARLVAALSDPAVRAKVIEITIGPSLQKIGASLEKRAVEAIASALARPQTVFSVDARGADPDTASRLEAVR